MTARKFAEELASYMRAGYQVINVKTTEEPRLEAAVREAVRLLGQDATITLKTREQWQDAKIVRWDIADGAIVFDPEGRQTPKAHKDAQQPAAFLSKLLNLDFHDGFAVSIAKGFCDFATDNSVLRRKIQNAIHDNGFAPQRNINGELVRYTLPLIVVSGHQPLHADLQPLIPTLEFLLPTEEELQESVDFVTRSSRHELSPELKALAVRNLRGLASVDAENALARAIVLHGSDPALLGVIKAEKAKVAKDSGALTFVSEDELRNIPELGGFDNVLEHIKLHALGFTKEARDMGIPYPKGIALAGPPGTGKSHLAKLVGKMLDMPTYFFDIASVFSALVGSSEQNVKKALEIVEAQHGAVIVLDELDKAIGGVHKSSNDSGVGKRVVGRILTWLTERKSPTYVIATLNRLADVPPEFLRSGRFDACFCTSLPTANDRKDIFAIHLRKRKCEDTLDMLRTNRVAAAELMTCTENFVGAEIESVVEESILITYRDSGHVIPSPDTLVAVARETKPLALTAGEDLKTQQDYMTQGWLRPVCKLQNTPHKRERHIST
jgi:MoxR-like ATPase